MDVPIPSSKAAPICAGLSLALPLVGVLLTYFLSSLPAFRGASDFPQFVPVFKAAFVGFPLASIGLMLAVAAIVRRERCVAVAIIGIIFDLGMLLLFAPLVWSALK